MYIVVNKSLDMSPGKIAAQVGHAVQYMCLAYASNISSEYPIDNRNSSMIVFDKWSKDLSTKIVLEANEKEWLKIKSIMNPDDVIVRDAGLTEIPEGSETVIAFWPQEKENAHKAIKYLRLLK